MRVRVRCGTGREALPRDIRLEREIGDADVAVEQRFFCDCVCGCGRGEAPRAEQLESLVAAADADVDETEARLRWVVGWTAGWVEETGGDEDLLEQGGAGGWEVGCVLYLLVSFE